MTDITFLVRQDELLNKRPTVIREAQIQRLEFRALYEECLDVICGCEFDAAMAVMRYTGRGNGR